jgi:epoxyqueuosine reductase QueG
MAVDAGFGCIGKNTLFVTQQYGNMVWLSVILTDLVLGADQLLTGSPYPENCCLCIDASLFMQLASQNLIKPTAIITHSEVRMAAISKSNVTDAA